MLGKKISNHHGLPRNKTIKAVGRKRLRSTISKGGRSPATQLSPSSKVDEDSGLGGDSFGADFSMDSSNSHSGSTTQRSPPTACAVPGGNSNSGFPGIVLSQFGASNEILVDSGIELCPKRLRLDMTEEANELPEEVASLPQCPDEGGRAKIVSFKNIPGLVLPATAVQVQQTTLLSIPPRQTIQQAHKPCVVEHLLKQKPSTSVPKTTTKLEKGSTRKKVKGHVLEGNLSSISSDGAYELQLLTQPELQHRARYQTEGSRGSVKDREGSGHPCVKLKGYDKSAVLQVFVASDGAQSNSVTPHLFYQACKVSGKNSTPCSEERIHGTTVLEILMQPEKDMTVSCDCVGILKERNVDVEQRMKSFVTRGKKKSTKCRLVFRTKVTLKSGVQEILQVVSQPISCTQPPGIPEICRKSRSSCSVEGNKELFIIGKNFYKDTEVVFKEVSPQGEIVWSSSVIPEKDFLQSNHLICQVPPYPNSVGTGEVEVQMVVVSCGKVSDPHPFVYLPTRKERNQQLFQQQKQQQQQLQPQQQQQQQEEQQIVTHRPPLPNGVSPSAVKLNEMYTESGGNLPFTTTAALKSNTYSSKEVLFLPQTVTSTSFPTVSTQKQNKNCSSVNGIVKEERISPLPPFPSGPHQVTRVLATVVPQIQMTSSLMPKFTQKALHSNTFTTATVLAPKISPNSTPSHVLGIANSNFAAPMEVKENVLENLIHMLKLLKSIPGNLHNPIVELVADEILRQVRKSNLRSESGAESLPPQNVQPQYVVPNVANEKPSEIQKPNDSVKNLPAFTTNANGLQLAGAPQTHEVNQENPAAKIFPLNTTYLQQCPEVQTVLQTNVTNIAANNATTHAYVPMTIEEPAVKNTQEAKVVFQENAGLFQNQGLMNEFSNGTVSFPNASNNGTMVHTFTRQDQNSTAAVVLPETSTASAKIEFVDPLNVSPREHTNHNEMRGTKLNQTENHMTNIFENDFKVIHPLQADNSSMSMESKKIEENMLQDSTTSNTISINAPLQFKMENCDPLLSQASALTTMTSRTTTEQLTMTTMQPPVETNLHSSEGTASSIIASTIGTTATTNEVPISSFSESELLDYINPTCFDNV
ncbi:UNVERIFIED_CONTAM: hypothetical protein RMT77_014200 [Armadillidium vulgare]